MASDQLGRSSHAAIKTLFDEVGRGHRVALAKILTVLEREGPRTLQAAPALLQPEQVAFRLGITGPPGAGKSTLIGQLIGRFRSMGKTVGVLAVDPSSPFTRGAVLGDRLRYAEHFTDPGVFIRSLGSRGSMGGLSAAVYLMVRMLDCAQFDIVLIETVGVGQTELEIMNVADWVAVTLVPESGDTVQGMKAGLLEIADLFLVNKGDRPGADTFQRELEASLALGDRGPKCTVLKTNALTGEGLDLALSIIQLEMNRSDAGGWRVRRQDPERLRAEARALMRSEAERLIEVKASKISNAEDFTKLFLSDDLTSEI